MTFVIALIALGLGYLVFLQASKERKSLKSLGQIVGAVIMICAFASMLCSAAKCRKMAGCPFSKAPMCSFQAKNGV